MDNESLNKFDVAADEALSKLVELYKGMTVEQREGADILFDWIKKHYRFAGYKRLGRIMKSLSENKSALQDEASESVRKIKIEVSKGE